MGGITGEWKGLGRVLRGCGRRWKGVGVDRRGGGPARPVNCVFLAPLMMSNVCRRKGWEGLREKGRGWGRC